MAQALYNKYRPSGFQDVVGQNHIEDTIKSAIDQNCVSHAYIFSGPRGTGKTTTARILARCILCEDGPTSAPCGTCANCLAVSEGNHPDVYEIDAASRTGVDNVREEIITKVNFASTLGRAKVYIIDEVHMLSTSAENALLKTLEEPPDGVYFILCTTDPQKITPTIQSRCQKFSFKRIPANNIVERLAYVCEQEDVSFTPEALEFIAKRSQGGMRDSLTTLEQLIVFTGKNIDLESAESLLGGTESTIINEFAQSIVAKDAQACFANIAQFVDSGIDLATVASELCDYLRNMYIVLKAGPSVTLQIPSEEGAMLKSQASNFNEDMLANMLSVMGSLMSELKYSTNPRLSFEIAMTRILRPESDLTLQALAARIANLEAMLASGKTFAVTAGDECISAPRTVEVEVPKSSAVNAMPAESSVITNSVVPAPGVVNAENSAPSTATDKASSDVENSTPSQPSDFKSVAASAPYSGAVANSNLMARLQRAWAGTLDNLRKSDTALCAIYSDVCIDFDNRTKEIVVEFPQNASFKFNRANTPAKFQALRDAMQAFTGKPPKIRLQEYTGNTGGFTMPQVSNTTQSVVAEQSAAGLATPSAPSASETLSAPAAPSTSAVSCEPSAYPATTAPATSSASATSCEPSANPAATAPAIPATSATSCEPSANPAATAPATSSASAITAELGSSSTYETPNSPSSTAMSGAAADADKYPVAHQSERPEEINYELQKARTKAMVSRVMGEKTTFKDG